MRLWKIIILAQRPFLCKTENARSNCDSVNRWLKKIMGENLIISRVLIVKATRIESLLNLFLFFKFFFQNGGKGHGNCICVCCVGMPCDVFYRMGQNKALSVMCCLSQVIVHASRPAVSNRSILNTTNTTKN